MKRDVHQSTTRRIRRALPATITLGVMLAGSPAFLTVPPASAHGSAETVTITFKDKRETFSNTDPCTGARETVYTTHNEVFHLTSHDDGHFHLGATFAGEFTAVPDDPARPTFVGRFTVRFEQNDNENMDNAQFTNRFTAEGSDGSIRRFNGLTHITAGAIDSTTDPAEVVDVKVAFERFRCQ